MPVALTALAGAAMTVWALDPSRWWDALEFRGPTNIVSLSIAGVAFVDATLARMTGLGRLSVLPAHRIRTAQAIAVAFAVVLSIQSLQYSAVIDDMNDMLAAADMRCVELADLPDMPASPLNLWSTPSLSLLYQGWSPDRVVLMDGDCALARENGTLAINVPATPYDSTRIDLVPLQWELGGHGACWWDEPGGWHVAEVTDIGRRRWSADSGTLRVFVGEATQLSFTGEMVSFTPHNTVEITVNGKSQATVTFDDTQERSLEDLTLHLDAGENIIRFTSANASGRAPGDPRDLAFSLLNVEPVPTIGETCSYRP